MPVISQTAYAFENETEEAKKFGFDEYLFKPVKKSMFYDFIKRFNRN